MGTSMRYIITEWQNEKLKRYQAIKEIVDSYTFPHLVKTEFELKWDDRFGFYVIEPTFYMNGFVPESSTQVMKHELCDRIESYLGIHIVSHNGYMKYLY
jgi:hypothetical protein